MLQSKERSDHLIWDLKVQFLLYKLFLTEEIGFGKVFHRSSGLFFSILSIRRPDANSVRVEKNLRRSEKISIPRFVCVTVRSNH